MESDMTALTLLTLQFGSQKLFWDMLWLNNLSEVNVLLSRTTSTLSKVVE